MNTRALWRSARWTVTAFFFILSIVAAPADAPSTQTVGVVRLHGKLGTPMGTPRFRGPTIGADLVAALRRAHYLVATPEMCFSRSRAFDETYTGCFHDIDAGVAELKARGATAFVVGGLSLGGNMAIAYGATHPGLLGVIALSPADDPSNKLRNNPGSVASVAHAQDLVAQGKGDAKTSFDDTNTGPQGFYHMSISTTPQIYLSFNGPDSLAYIETTITKLNVPLLWVAGAQDPTQSGGEAWAFDKAPPGALNRYTTVRATHLEVPDAATSTVLAWLSALRGEH